MKKLMFLILFLLVGCNKLPEIIKNTSFCEFNNENYEKGMIIEKEDEGIFYEMKCEDKQWS